MGAAVYACWAARRDGHWNRCVWCDSNIHSDGIGRWTNKSRRHGDWVSSYRPEGQRCYDIERTEGPRERLEGQRCYDIERTECPRERPESSTVLRHRTDRVSTEASCSVKRRSNDGSRVDGVIRVVEFAVLCLRYSSQLSLRLTSCYISPGFCNTRSNTVFAKLQLPGYTIGPNIFIVPRLRSWVNNWNIPVIISLTAGWEDFLKRVILEHNNNNNNKLLMPCV